ncbi:MAG: HEPN domain-containing protein [Thermoplasmata archaeon]|nr:HEPN domain-containing protein [Thermoplasmata archaeon]
MTDDYIKQWVIKADHDLGIVEHELNLPEEDMIRDAVCFHCQQAAEKYLKAFLVYHQKKFPRTHNIELLLEQCAKIDSDFADIEVRELSSFAVEIRYADDLYMPDFEEVEFYHDLAERIKRLALSKIGMRE